MFLICYACRMAPPTGSRASSFWLPMSSLQRASSCIRMFTWMWRAWTPKSGSSPELRSEIWDLHWSRWNLQRRWDRVVRETGGMFVFKIAYFNICICVTDQHWLDHRIDGDSQKAAFEQSTPIEPTELRPLFWVEYVRIIQATSLLLAVSFSVWPGESDQGDLWHFF